MAKKKLQRFAELATFPNVFQLETGLKGRWHSDYFHNVNPIVLELACGKAEYAVAMAQRFPEKNFVGVDIKGARLWRGAKTSLEMNLKNVAFLRIPIETIADWFAKDEVDEIWITFPDPYLRQSKARKRLTSPRFLTLYRQILKERGIVHLKTDEPNLFQFTLDTVLSLGGVIQEVVDDLHNSDYADELLAIQTTYERRHLADGRIIKYIRFTL